jgi:hypothetical protein
VTVILTVLEVFRISSNVQWFEDYVDFMSIQALLFGGEASNIWQQTKVLVRYQARVSSE